MTSIARNGMITEAYWQRRALALCMMGHRPLSGRHVLWQTRAEMLRC